jgi:FtsP/CotA-like multicopper oxidase with cupredoxin domain
MSTTRRQFMVRGAAAAAVGLAGTAGAEEPKGAAEPPVGWAGEAAAPGLPGTHYQPVVTPNGSTLPFKVIGGVKVFHLVAEPVTHTFATGLEAKCWGYNGSVHGPTIEAVEGDRVRIYVSNRLPAPTTVHWHGLYVPSGMDGVGGLSQRPIEPGETFKYEFTLRQHGTFMYHSHHDEMVQMALGLMGMFVVHPRRPAAPPPQRDYVYLLSEWAIKPGTRRPDPHEMTDFNVLTFNAAIFPATEPMVARTGDRVRIRIGNLSAMDHHPIHIHGTSFRVVETDGGVIPESGRWPETTVLVPTGSTRTIELIAANPGDWAAHCHMTHHVMTQMGHGIPNLIGVDPGEFDEAIRRLVPAFSAMTHAAMTGAMEEEDETMPPNSLPMMGGPGPHGYITMGGMFTILKVRDGLTSYEDPGWYDAPPGTQADLAAAEDLRRDGIALPQERR